MMAAAVNVPLEPNFTYEETRGLVGAIGYLLRKVDPDRVTPLSEGMQGIVWHCLVSHPVLQTKRTKW